MPAGLALPRLLCFWGAQAWPGGVLVEETGPRSRRSWKGKGGHPKGWLRHRAWLLPPLEPIFQNNFIQKIKIWKKKKNPKRGKARAAGAHTLRRSRSDTAAALPLQTCCAQGRALSTELTRPLRTRPVETQDAVAQVQPKSEITTKDKQRQERMHHGRWQRCAAPTPRADSALITLPRYFSPLPSLDLSCII